jgi:hypothetical protein
VQAAAVAASATAAACRCVCTVCSLSPFSPPVSQHANMIPNLKPHPPFPQTPLPFPLCHSHPFFGAACLDALYNNLEPDFSK